MKSNTHYILNKEFVVHELLEGELTVINLQKGFYFIARGSAIDIFLMLEQSSSINDMVTKLMSLYSVDDATAHQAISELVEQWLTEELITLSDTQPEQANNYHGNNLGNNDSSTAVKKDWIAPVFVAFDDMRDLLLLDPIHDTELDQQGWPVAADAKSENH